MKLGVVFPAIFGDDPILIRDFVQTVEGLGYDYILLYEQIAETPAESAILGWQEPLTVLSFIAALTDKLELATGITVLGVRQTVLFAKQAAQLDRLCGGRLRLGVSAGWHEAEYQAMAVDFQSRGRRLNEQVRLLRQLWTQPHVTFQGEFHTLNEIGVHPQPLQSHLPIWFGGHSDAALRRIASLGDGWMAVAGEDMTPQTITSRLNLLRRYCEEAGRDPHDIGLEIVDVRPTEQRDWAQWVTAWQTAGATHLDICTRDQGLTTPEQHFAAIENFKKALA